MTKQQSTFKYGKVRMLSQYLSCSAHFAPPRGNISNGLSLNREDAPHFCEAGVTRRMRRKRGAHDYEPSTWRRLARAVHDKQVPGGHNTCVTTFAGVVANELQGIFAGRNSGRRMR
jgi:hypothetical protein